MLIIIYKRLKCQEPLSLCIIFIRKHFHFKKVQISSIKVCLLINGHYWLQATVYIVVIVEILKIVKNQ